MKYRTGQLVTSQPIRSASRRLVATRHAPGRGPKTSEYDSSDRLPDIEEFLDSTVRKIQGIHLIRERNQQSFDRLWEQVCARLTELGNASAYARWKQNETSQNLDQFQELDTAVAKAWASGRTPIEPEVSDSPFYFDDRQFRRAKEERSALKLEIDISIDHVLEVAIAYWIEAMNAHKGGDDLRAMHALIQCHFNLGIAQTLRMTHDSKADDGRQSGQKERDALAETVLKVMENFIVDGQIRNVDFLLGRIIEAIEADPIHAEVLGKYDELVTRNRPAADAISARFSNTLLEWVTGKKQPYPEVTVAFRNLTRQIKKKRPNKNVARRKANG